jgi:hypothetical protein
MAMEGLVAAHTVAPTQDRHVLREQWLAFRRLGRRPLEFGHSRSYLGLGRGVRRDALLTAAGKPGRLLTSAGLSAVSKASRLTWAEGPAWGASPELYTHLERKKSRNVKFSLTTASELS